MSFGKEIALFFFNKGPDIVEDGKTRNIFTCKSSALVGRECTSNRNNFKVNVANGYGNLRSHLCTCIPEFQKIYDEKDEVVVVGDIRNYVAVDKKSNNIFKWCKFIVTENLPFSFVEKKLVRENSCRDPISRTKLMKYLDCLSFYNMPITAINATFYWDILM